MLFSRSQRESRWQGRCGCPSQRRSALWKAAGSLLGPSPSNYKPEPGQNAWGSFCWWLQRRPLQIQEPHPAPEAHIGSVSSPAQVANLGDSGQTTYGGGGWPWAAPEPLSSPRSRWQSHGKSPPFQPGRTCRPCWAAPASPAAAAMCWELVPSQQLSAGLLIPPCPWLPAQLPRWRWARSHRTSTGTGAAGAARIWQGRQAAEERPSSSAWLIGVSLGPPLCQGGWRVLRAHGVIINKEVGMRCTFRCAAAQVSGDSVVWLKQAWRN